MTPDPADRYEQIAEQLIHYLIEQALFHAECPLDPGHTIVVVWHPAAVEHLAAKIAELTSPAGSAAAPRTPPSTSIQVPADHRIATRVSYGIPSHCHSIQSVRIAGRKWWQFWLPAAVNLYCVVEPATPAHGKDHRP